MSSKKFEKVIELIDQKNSEDPNNVIVLGKELPKELLYSQRMTKKLLEFRSDASQELQIAARAQHICRWKINRNQYPMNRLGYLKWREQLKKMHANLTSDILLEIGYNSEFIDRVTFLINKKLIKRDEGSQTLEDVICLVFLEYYFEEFAKKHPDEKVIDILQKTWKKMSAKGHDATKTINFSSKSRSLLKKAIP